MIKYLNIILATIISVLLILSVLALVEIHWILKDMQFSITPESIEFYLASLGKYKYLFSGTIATCSAHFALLSVKATNDSNVEKKKQDRFNEWKTILQISFSEITKDDPIIVRYITQYRLQIFNSLYDLDFKIENVEQLTGFFNDHFKDKINSFETQNKKNISLGAVYPTPEYSYSFDSFSYIFFAMIELWYDEIRSDMKRLYIDNLPENRIINAQDYKASLDAANSPFVRYDDL